MDVQTSEHHLQIWRWIFVLGSYFYLLYFQYLWLSTWYNIYDTKAAGKIKKEMILDRVTLKQGKIHCGWWLITDPIACCYGCGSWTKSAVWRWIHWDEHTSDVWVQESRSVSDVYSYSFRLHRNVIKKCNHNDKLLSTEATFGFSLLS